MKQALIKYPSSPFSIPENIEMVKIDALSGLLPNTKTSKTIYEAFITGTAPLNSEILSNEKVIDLKPLDDTIY